MGLREPRSPCDRLWTPHGREFGLNTLALGMPGGWEWLIIGVVMLLLFGSRLPSVARSIGDAMREFKKGMHDIGDDIQSPPPQQRSYNSAKPPLTSGGVDQRVSQGPEPEPAHRNIDSSESAGAEAPRD
ncbi:MAG: twin-arginine translocase TatA/TatE family subunit [Phycisphaeraceae bacterium]|nr:MAG: twin-arginine translocase TatA/TatE family subunit [Phycisphaeraceae bacterium]